MPHRKNQVPMEDGLLLDGGDKFLELSFVHCYANVSEWLNEEVEYRERNII